MTPSTSLFRYSAIVVPLLLASGFIRGEEPITDAERLFTLKVKPMLSEKCNGCHGDDPDKIKGEFKTLTREDLLKGGESVTKVLVPGDAKKSFILTSVRWEDEDYEMPPKENDRLTTEQIANLEAWIKAGAPWPDDAKQEVIRTAESRKKITDDGMIVDSSGGQSSEWTTRRYKPEDIWAFMPVKKPQVPAKGHPIDAFINDSLTQSKITAAPKADARTLIRRATFDLLGLPPTPEEVTAFEASFAQDPTASFEALVDRLLESPHYGERWGQHWLDVARYADTGGLSNDYERSNAWRYRDYVIRSFNSDKPYNQFIVEQIAGDELNPKDPEMLVATGFLRMGPFDNAMVKVEEARQIFLDDVVNSVGQTFLATTMRCFKCHDHKFDPLPTKDYYRVYATFACTQMAERPASFLTAENRIGFDEGREQVKRLLDYAETRRKALIDKQEAAAHAWYDEHKLPYVGLDERKDMEDEVKPPRFVGLSPEEQGILKVREQDVRIWTRRLERYEPMTQSVYNGPVPKFFNSGKLRMPEQVKTKNAPESYIYNGGSIEAPGDKVTPGVISSVRVSVEGQQDSDPYALSKNLEGRRLGLAKWIADPRNPLTTRSIVNRIWQQHFGKPIAGNPNNFGVKGAKPTHPELLDWLASEFVEGGWTMKRLHRLIMLSDAYQRATRSSDMKTVTAADPNNDLLAYFPTRRLTAEELRDGMLAITGELNPEMGGLPIMPEINMEVALQPRMIQFSLAPAYQPTPTTQQRNRRTIYAYRVRGMADPFLELFNQPNPNDSCEMRNAASVSPQSFTLLNSDVVNDRSIAFAQRLEKEASNTETRIRRAFQIALNRNPTPEEVKRLTIYVGDMIAYHQKASPKATDYPTEITRTLIEEFTGEPFEYTEWLPAFEHYQPDAKASDVSPETRALADACLLLFNANEFIYLN